MKLAVANIDLDWSGIEVAEVDDKTYVQLAFAHYKSGDDVSTRWYWVSGKKNGVWFETLFDDPESGVNKSRAYELYWQLEAKLMGHYEF